MWTASPLLDNRLRKVACVAAPCLAPKSLRHPLPYLLDEALGGPSGLRRELNQPESDFLDEAVPSGFGFGPKPDSGRLAGSFGAMSSIPNQPAPHSLSGLRQGPMLVWFSFRRQVLATKGKSLQTAWIG